MTQPVPRKHKLSDADGLPVLGAAAGSDAAETEESFCQRVLAQATGVEDVQLDLSDGHGPKLPWSSHADEKGGRPTWRFRIKHANVGHRICALFLTL